MFLEHKAKDNLKSMSLNNLNFTYIYMKIYIYEDIYKFEGIYKFEDILIGFLDKEMKRDAFISSTSDKVIS